jgi:hypothetical protein
MKTKLLLFIVIASALVSNCSAALLVYKYSGIETQILDGHERSFNISGEMFYDSVTNCATFVGWGTLTGHKTYWTNTTTNWFVSTIQGVGKSYTLLNLSTSDYDSNGFPNLSYEFYRGINARLKIATGQTLSFPQIFICTETTVDASESVSALGWGQANTSLVFQPASTQKANNQGQTAAGLANALVQSLQNKGYEQEP